MSTVAATKTFPVIETFGPTIQGEGALAGLPTHFIRFGGCDYRCEWCDSMYAVEPAEVREHARKLTEEEISEEVQTLPGRPGWVTISGGNPAMLELGPVCNALHGAGFKVAVETQGSIWRDWLWLVEMLTVSPKPPSSGMVSGKHAEQTNRFMEKAIQLTPDRRALKIVVMDETDFEWASAFMLDRRARREIWPEYLSVGTDPPERDPNGEPEPVTWTLQKISDRYRWLCEKVAADPMLRDVRVLPQLHVLAWAHARGV